MTFKKLALAVAITAVPMATFAVDVLDDSDLAAATGQDGIRIALDLSLTTDTIIHDKDGLGATGYNEYAFSVGGTVAATPNTSYSFAGGILIQGMSISSLGAGPGADGVVIEIDAGDNNSVSSAPMLNINVQLGATTIVTGNIYAVNSNRDNGTWGTDTLAPTAIISSATIVLGGVDLNIQLGNEAQSDGVGTHMVSIGTSIINGVSISNTAINDANSGGAIRAGVLSLKNHNNNNLDAYAYADVTGTGLQITIAHLGDTQGIDVRMQDVRLGSAGAGVIGDIEMQKLNLSGTVIEISGK